MLKKIIVRQDFEERQNQQGQLPAVGETDPADKPHKSTNAIFAPH